MLQDIASDLTRDEPILETVGQTQHVLFLSLLLLFLDDLLYQLQSSYGKIIVVLFPKQITSQPARSIDVKSVSEKILRSIVVVANGCLSSHQ